MKIEHPDRIHELNGPLKNKATPKCTDGVEFASVLKKASKKTPAGQVQPSHLTPPANSTISALGIDSRGGPGDSATRLIDSLEEYQRTLANPKANLKQVQRAVDQMKAQAVQTQSLVKALPGGHVVKDVLKNTLMQINMECVRFERGEYIDN